MLSELGPIVGLYAKAGGYMLLSGLAMVAGIALCILYLWWTDRRPRRKE